MSVGDKEKVLRASIDATDARAVFSLTQSGDILSCTQTYIRPIFGFDQADLIGKNVSMLLFNRDSLTLLPNRNSDDDVDGAFWNLSTTTATTTSSSSSSSSSSGDDLNWKRGGTMLMRHKDGSVLDVDVGVYPFFCEGDKRQRISLTVRRVQADVVLNASDSDGSTGLMARELKRRTAVADQGFSFGAPKKHSAEQRRAAKKEEPMSSDNGSSFSRSPGSTLMTSSSPPLSSTSSGSPSLTLSNGGLSSSSRQFTAESGFVLERRIGRGSYGVVKTAVHIESGEQVAVKILHKDLMKDKEANRTRKEVTIMRQVRHPHITRLIGTYDIGTRLYIVMEYNRGGELAAYIKSFGGGHFPPAEARRLFTQLATCLHYCHSNNIVHRDLSTKNILLDADKNAKLIDFGLSTIVVPGNLRSTFCGTPKFASPEMILGTNYFGPSVDVWSCGVVLYRMLTSKFPFNTVIDIINARCDLDVGQLSSDARDLLSRIFQLKSSERISIADVVAHPYIDADLVRSITATASTLVPPPVILPTAFDDSSSDSLPADNCRKRIITPPSSPISKKQRES
jgi:Protein kinase domain